MSSTDAHLPAVGFSEDEIALDQPTRAARLKWVLVVDTGLGPGHAVNAAACVAAATGAGINGLLGPSGLEADGTTHPGLPWSGCSVLGGTAEQLAVLREKADRADGVWFSDMPRAAQETRVYSEYLDAVARGEGLDVLAVSVVGPRNKVDKLTKGMDLLV